MKRGLICLSLIMILHSAHVRASEPVTYQVAADAVAAAVFTMPASKDIGNVEQDFAVIIEALKEANPGREKVVDAFGREFFGVILPACETGVHRFISYRLQSNLSDDVMQDVYAFLKTEDGAAYFQALSPHGPAMPDTEGVRGFLASRSGREFLALGQNLNQPPGSFKHHCDVAQTSAARKHVERYAALGITFTPEVLEVLSD